jgi:hypothetical protein
MSSMFKDEPSATGTNQDGSDPVDWARLLSAIADPALRRARLGHFLRHASDVTTLEKALESPRAELVTASLALALGDLPPPRLLQLARLAKGHPMLQRMLPQPSESQPPTPIERVVLESSRGVPKHPSGQLFTLGERKAMAAKPTREGLGMLLTDPHPAVIRRLLQNPRLTENDVVALAARRPNAPLVLRELALCTRFATSPRLRRALAANPSCPDDVAIRLTVLLGAADARFLLAREDLSPERREAAARVLETKHPSVTPTTK